MTNYKPIISWGLIGGLILVVGAQLFWHTMGTEVSYSTAETAGYITIGLSLATVFFSVRKYREDVGQGYITYGKAFQVGVFTALIPSLSMFAYTVVFQWIEGDRFFEWADAEMSKLPPEQYQAFLDQAESMGTGFGQLLFQGLVMFLTVFVIGIVVSAVVAAILKKEPDRIASADNSEI